MKKENTSMPNPAQYATQPKRKNPTSLTSPVVRKNEAIKRELFATENIKSGAGNGLAGEVTNVSYVEERSVHNIDGLNDR